MHTATSAIFGRSLPLTGMVFLGLTVLLSPAAAADRPVTGEQIYKQRCASCHGTSGQGSEDYPDPLIGSRSEIQLTRFIARTMPKGTKVKCSPEDAKLVAAYVFDTFYSPAAQARNKPPRIEVTRLTVRQYRNAVADLVGSFRPAGKLDPRRGLRGEYYRSRQLGNNRDRLLDRVDPAVQFDFGVSGPDAKKFDDRQFSIRWTGAVLAPETGEYEFIVRTEHATRLWVNDLKKPLIDAWVKSGDDTEHKATIYLLGGRVYPLRLDFSKAKQGVDDSKTNKKKRQIKASIALAWKLPGRTPEVIPQRSLSPAFFPEAFVAQTAFPPDDRSVGYERGTSVSKAWDAATTDAAIETAGYVGAHLGELAGVRDGAPDRAARLRDFCRRFAERAFRRPLTPEQQRLYVDRRFEGVTNPDTAVKRVVLLVLKSPWFLYQEIGEPDAYTVASRLSFGLWDSLPDPELLAAAAKGQLATREQVLKQAERMTADPRARAKVREFFLQWLKVEQVPDLAKDAKLYPDFDKALASDLRTSLDLFLEDVIWSDASDFRQLLLADTLYLNGRLARFYGADLPADAPFQKVSLKTGDRAGVLSHPYLMSTFAYTGTSSPIHRGVFLARSVLGLTLRPPPEAFTPLAPDLHPQLTTRERVLLQTRPQACQSCHSIINPLGFTLENFDAVGRYRPEEKGRPIDATGGYLTRTGAQVKFSGLRDLAKFLAGSDEVHDAFVQQLFHYLVKQPIRAYGPRKLADLRQAFADKQYNIRKLLVEIMADSALVRREEKPTAPAPRDARAAKP